MNETRLLFSEQSMAILSDAYRMQQFIIGFVGVVQSAARDPHSQSQTINEVTSDSERRRWRLAAAVAATVRLHLQLSGNRPADVMCSDWRPIAALVIAGVSLLPATIHCRVTTASKTVYYRLSICQHVPSSSQPFITTPVSYTHLTLPTKRIV